MKSLKFIHSYLNDRKKRLKIYSQYSSFKEMLFDVPQGSLLGPLLLKPFICDLFLTIKDIDIASYADDNIPYCSYDKFDDVVARLEKLLRISFKGCMLVME